MIDVPADWQQACREIHAAEWRRVVVVGPNGAGKSTFSRHLADVWDAALLDADIGQQETGPPATVSLRRPDRSLSALYFVGGTSPMGHLLALLAGTARLAHLAENARLVCNTSGLVGGPGVALKTFKIDVLQPDALVMVAPGRETEAIANAHRHLPILAVKPSTLARQRSAAERRAMREAAFARYLVGAENGVFTDAVQQRRRPREDIDGLLCGLADRVGSCLGIGLLRTLSPLTIFTPVPPDAVRLVQFGDLRLRGDGGEIGPTRIGPQR